VLQNRSHGLEVFEHIAVASVVWPVALSSSSRHSAASSSASRSIVVLTGGLVGFYSEILDTSSQGNPVVQESGTSALNASSLPALVPHAHASERSNVFFKASHGSTSSSFTFKFQISPVTFLLACVDLLEDHKKQVRFADSAKGASVKDIKDDNNPSYPNDPNNPTNPNNLNNPSNHNKSVKILKNYKPKTPNDPSNPFLIILIALMTRVTLS
jgi:hypothetical protein